MSIVTKTGDEGLTSLWSGERVWKDDLRVEAYGTVDELSSQLGLARHHAKLPATVTAIDAIQRSLVRVGAELASRGQPFTSPIGAKDEESLTRATEGLEARIPLRGFVVPGMTESSASLDVARSVCRRAERRVVALARDADVSDTLRSWLNRLSDYLFMLARAEEEAVGKITFVNG
ncbi:MAG: cob(I)yrinic acid a,c-diamide adenosyltransferase [Spirochaetota bacterium]